MRRLRFAELRERRPLVLTAEAVHLTEDGWRRFHHLDLAPDPEGYFEPLTARQAWAEATALEVELAHRIARREADEAMAEGVTIEAWCVERLKRLKAHMRTRRAA